MRIADECRRRALVLRELAKESPQLYDQCAAVADARLTLAATTNLILSSDMSGALAPFTREPA
jgi:hypothetical protein